LKTASSCWK